LKDLAEEIEIINVGGENGVASEATLKQLLAAMNKMAGGGSGGASAEAKARKLANEALAKGTTAQIEGTAAREKQTDAVKKATRATDQFSEKVGSLTAQGLKSLLSSTVNLGKEMLVGGTRLSDFTQHLPGVGSLITPLAAIIDDTIDSFRQLSASGASFGNNIEEMRRVSAQSGLTLDEFSSIVIENSENLRFLGGTVTQGARRFVDLNKGLKESGNFEQLKQMGFSVIEINEGMADYIGLQARMGRLQGKSTAELAAGSANYLKQIDMLAKVTGMTRKEAENALSAQAADAGARALLNQFKEGSEQFKNLQMSLGMIEDVGGPAATAMKDLLDGAAQTEEGQMLLASAGPEVAEALRQVGQGADPKVLLNAMKNAGGSLEEFAGATGTERAMLIASLRETNPVLAGLMDGATRMIAKGEADLDAAEGEQAKRDDITASLATFDDTLRQIRQDIQTLLIDSGIFSAVAGGLSFLAETFRGIAGGIEKFTTAIAEGDIWGAVSGLFTSSKAIGALAFGITALFLGKAAIGAITSGVGALMGKLGTGLSSGIGKIFGGGGGPASQAVSSAPKGGSKGGGFAKGAGNAGKGIGNFIGNMGSGIMKGAAAGLRAFANPAILLGAGILAGAIVVIGGAIAGATWLLGKALPSLAEGLESFGDIDGGNLLRVAGGMAALGGALAVFGAGAAVGAIGNTIANILDALPGKGPLEKLVEFSNVPINAAKVKANAEALSAYGKALAAQGGGAALGAIGNTAANIVSGIVGMFGGSTEPPWDKIKEFGELQLNTQGIIANAGAVRAYAVAIADFPQTPAPSLLSSFKTGVASFFGAETDPFAPIRNFGNTRLNTRQIISNAGAISAYAVAIKDFPESPQASVLGAFKSGLASLLGGDADPMAPIKRFGELQLNTAQIIANAYAVSAYAAAIKDFPESPQANVLGAFKGAVASLLGGDSDPMAPIKRFGDLTLNTAGITANAAAVKAYADAIKDFPESPQANVLSAFKGGLASLLGGDKDPMAPIKRFGDLTLNTTGIKANAEAVSAYAAAIKDFPESPSTTLLNSFRTGIASLLGGETDPMAPIKAFGDLTLNTAGIKANAEAVSAYALAIKDFPESPATTILTSLRTGIASLLGGETDPFAPMKRFGDLSLNTTGITANAGAVKAFADAMANMPQVDSTRSGGVLGAMKDWFAGEEEMPWDAVSKFGSAKINVDGVTNNAAAINAMSTSLSNFALEKLDSEGIISYTNSIKDLVAQLKALNVELKKDNDGYLTDRASAGELLNNISLSTSAGAGNTGEVASLLQQLIELTMQQLELDEKIERNTKDARGSDLLVSSVTEY